MKKLLLTMALIAFTLVGAMAQQRLTHPAPNQKEPVKSCRQQVMDHSQCSDPKKAAEMETMRIKGTLDLTNAQTKRVYKLLLKEMKGRACYDNKCSQERNGFKGRGHGPQIPADKVDGCCSHKKAGKCETKCMTRSQRDAAMRKILNDDQYTKWTAMSNRLTTGRTR